MKRGGGLHRQSPLKRTGRLRPFSAKRTAQRDTWDDVKAFVDRRDRGVCRLASPTCWGPRDPHHVWPTGQGGPRLDPANVITLCRGHHSWCHDHPAEARLLGVLR